MKFLINDSLPELQAGLERDGHIVFSSPNMWFSTLKAQLTKDGDDELDEWNYPLNRLLAESIVDVCIIVDPWRYPGIRKAHAVKWSMYGRHKTLIYWDTKSSEDRPDTKPITRCKCKKASADIIVSHNLKDAQRNQMFGTSIHYTGNTAGLVGLIQQVQAGATPERLNTL